MNKNIERLLVLAFMAGCMLMAGCSKDDEEQGDPGQPNENNEIVLVRNISVSIPLYSATSTTPPGEWLFCLADDDGNEYLIPGSAGEKKDGTYLHLDFSEGDKCVTYTVKYVTNAEQTVSYDLGFTITLYADGTITCQDVWDEDLELFGKGTKEWPYKISSLKDIATISAFCDDNRWKDTWFVQICDIRCDEGVNKSFNEKNGGIKPIGLTSAFEGHYNGQGHTINKLKFIASGTTDNIALFSVLGGNATVDSLRIDAITIEKGNENIAALAAVMQRYASVAHCAVTNGRVSGIKNVGGLIGKMEGGSVSNCESDDCDVMSNMQNNPYTDCIGGMIGHVRIYSGHNIVIKDISSNSKVIGNENIGGVIGFVDSPDGKASITLENLTMGLMSITGERSVGGVIGGCNADLTLKGCSNRSVIDMQGSDRRDFGGIIGAVSTTGSVVVENCWSGRNKSGVQPDPSQKYIDGGLHTGGLVGYARADGGITLRSCALTSNTYGLGQVGGLIGLCASGATIENCKNESGNIQSSGSHAGGLIGQATSTVTFNSGCENQGNVTATDSYAGGFVGQASEMTLTGGRSLANVTAGGKHSGGYVGYAANLTAGQIDVETITGTVSAGEAVGGLAGYATKASVKNVKIGYIVGKESSTAKYSGGLIGILPSGEISQCTFTGSVQGGENTGGIVGKQRGGTISKCTTRSENRILCNGGDYVGGIAGFIESTVISGCDNHTRVANVEESSYTGGIVGYIETQDDSKQIRECNNYAAISGGDVVGGIVGGHIEHYFSNIQVANCHNTGDIYGRSEVGGIFGRLGAGQIYRCSNRAAVKGKESVAGIAGALYGHESYYPRGLVKECFNTGRIDGDKKIGGVVGRFYKWGYVTVENSYNKGEVGHDGSESCAGIVGHIDNNAYSNIKYCYSGGTQRTGWGIAGRYFALTGAEVSFVRCHYSNESAPSDKMDNSNCTKNSNAGLGSKSNFKDWDFTNTWTMVSMPELQNNRETNQ